MVKFFWVFIVALMIGPMMYVGPVFAGGSDYEVSAPDMAVPNHSKPVDGRSTLEEARDVVQPSAVPGVDTQRTQPSPPVKGEIPLSSQPTTQQENISASSQNQAAPKKNRVQPAPPQAPTYSAGDIFKDCPECPEMVVIGPGVFSMGVDDGGMNNDAPLHNVEIKKHLAVSMMEITFDQWDACVRDGGCGGYSPDDNDWGRKGRPVMNVSWRDALSYVQWLSSSTQNVYRLMSEAEWEYAARARSKTSYTWGDALGKGRANCADCGSRYDAQKTAPVGTFKGNYFGLFDVSGNVWEWVADCYAPDSYTKHKNYPKPYIASEECNRVLRGGAWDLIGVGATTHYRFNASEDFRSNTIGFRIARELKE